jgi:hypothetical protein
MTGRNVGKYARGLIAQGRCGGSQSAEVSPYPKHRCYKSNL